MRRKRNYKPHFSAFLLPILYQVLAQALGQQVLDAGVQFGNEMTAAGDTSVLRFTFKVPEQGDLIRTYLPSSVSYLGTSSKVDLCNDESHFMESKPIDNCVYVGAANMIEFRLPADASPGDFFTYELGYLRNPSFSQMLTGLKIEVFASGASQTALYVNNEISVRVKAGKITQQALKTDSLRVAAVTKFTFTFKVTNPVPAGGTIIIDFPLSHFEVPSSERVSRISVNGGSWTSPQQTIWQSGIHFSVPAQGISAGAQIVIEIEGMSNPNTMIETDSFSLTTLTAAQDLIDTTTSGFVTKMKEAADLTIKEFNVNSKVVGQTTYITASLVLPTVYEANGYLTVTLPATVEINSNFFSCRYYIGFFADQDTDKCSVTSSKVVRIDGNVSQKQITFSIFSVVNPTNTKPTDSFVFHIFDTQNNMIASSINQSPVVYTPTPANLASVAVTRQDSTVGAKAHPQTNVVQFVLKTTNSLKNNEVIEFRVPVSQFLLTDIAEVQCLSSGPQSTMQPTACTIDMTPPAEHFVLRYSVKCVTVCPPQSTFTLSVTGGISNPTWISAANSITSVLATTLTADLQYKIDQRTSNVIATPGLVEGSLTQMQLQKTPGLVGAATSLSFSFKTLNLIPKQGSIAITFADDSLQLSEPLASPRCQGADESSVFVCQATTYASGQVKTISIRDPCGSNTVCPPVHSLTFKISNVRNPRSTKPIQNMFIVSSSTVEGFAIDKGSMQAVNAAELQIEPALFKDVSLIEPNGSTIDIVTGALQQSYLLRVELNNGLIANDGSLVVEFPSQLRLAVASVCQAYTEVGNELLECTSDPNSKKVTVKHTKAGIDFRGLAIMVRLVNAVQNPPSTKPSDSLIIHTGLRDAATGVNYFVDRHTKLVTVTANKPNRFSSITITRSEVVVSSVTDLKVCIVPSNDVPANSRLSIVFPEDQAVVQTSLLDFRANGLSLTATHSGLQSTVVLPDPMTSGAKFCFDIAGGGITNPGKTSPPQTSFEMRLKTADNFSIDETLTDIFAQPYLSAGPFQSAKLEASGSEVGGQASFKATLTLKSPLPAGSQFFIKLPLSVFYIKDGAAECAINGGSFTTCKDQQTVADSKGNYLQSVRVFSPVALAQGSTVSLETRNLRNKFDARSLSSSEMAALVQSYDDNDFTINSSSVTLELPTLSPCGKAKVLTASRSELAIQKSTTVTLEVQTETRFLSQSVLQVFLSNQLFEKPASVACTLDSQPKLCTFSTNTASYILSMSVQCQNGLCPDRHRLTVTVSGLTNRYSTTREGNSPYQEVYLKTYDQTGKYQIDFSDPAAFSSNLVAGSVALDPNSLVVTRKTVGQTTDFSFSLSYPGLMTKAGDTITVNFGKLASSQDSGLLFSVEAAAELFVNDSKSVGAVIQRDSFGFLKSLRATIPATSGRIAIRVSQIENLGRVQPLKASVSIEINDSRGGQIAAGLSQIENLDFLEPIAFTVIKIERTVVSLATATDIDVSISLDSLAILPGSVLQLFVPKEHLTLSSGGQLGSCQVISDLKSSASACWAVAEGSSFVVTTGAILEGSKGQKVTVRISRMFENPRQIMYTNASIKLAVTNAGFAIGASDPALKITIEPPLQKDKLQDVFAKLEGLVTGMVTQLTFGFSVMNRVPEDSALIFSLPAGILLYEGYTRTNQLICEASTKLGPAENLPCEVTTTTIGDTSPQYVSEIRVQVTERSARLSDFMTPGFQNIVTFKNALNADFVKDRATSAAMIQLNVVTSSGYIVAQGSVGEAELPSLVQASITQAKMSRDSVKLGQYDVDYTLVFSAASVIPSNAFLVLHIPSNEIKVRESDLQCQETRTLRNLACKFQPASEDSFNIKVEELCKYRLCSAREELSIVLNLANANQIVFESESRSIGLAVFTSQGDPVQRLATKVVVGPLLEGSRMRDFEVERLANKVGSPDILRFYLPPIENSLFQETHLIVDLPYEVAYMADGTNKLVCVRELETGDKRQLECDSVTLPGTTGAIIRSVRLRNFCEQFYVCFANEPLSFSISVRNPSTNQRPKGFDNKFKIILRQASGLDVGFGIRDLVLPPMHPSSATVSMKPLSNSNSDACKRAGAKCHLLLNVATVNTIQPQSQGGYMKVVVPDDFLVLGNECWAFIGDTDSSLSCYIKTKTVQVRAVDEKVAALKAAGNKLKIIVETVRMPLTTLPVVNAVVENLELIDSAQNSNSKVFSLLDTNEESPGLSQVVTLPSRFKSVEVQRRRTQVGSTTPILFSVQALASGGAGVTQNRDALSLALLEGSFKVQVPLSAGKIAKSLCYSGPEQPVNGACHLQKSQSSTHETLVVKNLKAFCRTADLVCSIYIADFANAWFTSEEEDPLRDAFSFTLYYTQANGTQVSIFEDASESIFARPRLEPLALDLGGVSLSPITSETAQEIALAFNLTAQLDHVFADCPFLLTEFAPLTYKPVLGYEFTKRVFVNGVEAKILRIETVDRNVDLSITAVFVELPKSPTIDQSLEVRFTGFKNPNYVDAANLKGSITVSLLGGSIELTELRARSSGSFGVDLKPYRFSSLSLFSKRPWPGELTHLELAMTMTNKVNLDEIYQVSVELPHDFQVQAPKLTCSNLFDQSKMPCKLTSDRKVLVGLTSAGRTTTSQLSFMSIGIVIGPVKNPDRPIKTAPVPIRVLQVASNKVYVEDSTQIYVLERGSECPTGCAECSTDNRCFACLQPSTTPLLADGACHSVCPEGQFLSRDRCFTCDNECSTCHSLDQCSSCFKDDAKVFVDGRCLPDCPVGTIQSFQTENICLRAQDRPPVPSPDNLPIFQVDYVDTLAPCKVDNCDACGLSSDFCTLCSEGFVRKAGQCKKSCGLGFFDSGGICFKCSPLCETCSGSANQCDSCPSGVLSTFTKLLKDQHMCGSSCPPGTYEADGQCLSCDPTCNTCAEKADKCTSCFFSGTSLKDLYFTDGVCSEKCPWLTKTNMDLHTCEPMQPFSLHNWPMILLLVAMGAPITLLILSQSVSKSSDRPWELAAGLSGLSEAGVKCAFWVTLWRAQSMILFAATGVSALCSVLLSVIFYETTALPVYRSIREHRKAKGVEEGTKGQSKAFTAVRVLAYLSSVTTSRLLSSSFCALMVFKMDLSEESPCFYLKRKLQAGVVQILLTTLWSSAAIASLLTAGLTEEAVGCALASTVTSIVAISLQARVHFIDKEKSGGYRTLMTHQ